MMVQKGFVKRYLTVSEVATYFSVSRSRVYEWVHDGKLNVWHPEGKVGSRGIRVLAESVTQLEQQGQIPTDDFFR